MLSKYGAGYKEKLFELVKPSCQLKPVWLFSSDHSHHRDMSTCRTIPQLTEHLFFSPFCGNPKGCYTRKSQDTNYFEIPIIHYQPWHAQSHREHILSPILMSYDWVHP